MASHPSSIKQRGLAVVTGASAGLGAEFARQLHAAGANVLLIARRTERLDTLCTALNSQRPASAACLTLDLADPAQLAELEARLRSEAVEILVNNAGFGTFGPFEHSQLERETEMARLNVLAQLRLSHAALAGMRQRGSGAIINLASVAGFQPLPYMSTYCATKAFDLFHSLALHYELKSHGIKVLAVCPGPTETEFRQVSGMAKGLGGRGNASAEQVVSASLKALMRGRAIVIPGWKAKLMVFFAAFCPIGWRTAWMHKILRAGLTTQGN